MAHGPAALFFAGPIAISIRQLTMMTPVVVQENFATT
jgi:hypothetical protein